MISELLTYDFMQRAILAVIAISIFSPILGLFLILRRQSLMSDTLSHVSLAGEYEFIEGIGCSCIHPCRWFIQDKNIWI